jgi:hypothetical protein
MNINFADIVQKLREEDSDGWHVLNDANATEYLRSQVSNHVAEQTKELHAIISAARDAYGQEKAKREVAEQTRELRENAACNQEKGTTL